MPKKKRKKKAKKRVIKGRARSPMAKAATKKQVDAAAKKMNAAYKREATAFATFRKAKTKAGKLAARARMTKREREWRKAADVYEDLFYSWKNKKPAGALKKRRSARKKK